MTDATGTILQEYDQADRLTKITYANGRSLQFTYNNDGQRTKLIAQDGYTVNYAYDATAIANSKSSASETLIPRDVYNY